MYPLHSIQYKAKKNIFMLPSYGIFECLGRTVGNFSFFFLIIFFTKHQKVQHLGAFSTFFLIFFFSNFWR